MNWEQKLEAMKSVGGDTSLRMRKPGDWYVSSNVHIAEGSMLVGEYGNGATPEAAVLNHWDIYSRPDAVVVAEFATPREKRVRWDGFRWIDLEPDATMPRPML